MSDIVIKAENLSKYYKLGVINNGTLFRDIQTWIDLKRGKQDRHSKIGSHKYEGNAEGFWALKDLNFEIHQGDRVGIIGKNGAGKSTLLKILSRITAPTEGKVKIKGRVASLLEVGTGFHGELTGRENIYLNGAILGMKKKEVDRKIDEIIAFSEIEQHIDTPVKRYSSGMYVRLAFAVAAHLDSEILIADEVLAVGDASFQKKALGKMNELSTGQGRTVLFVSHNMMQVKNLCTKGIVLEKGQIVRQDDNIDRSIAYYLGVDDNKNISINYSWIDFTNIGNTYFKPIEIKILNQDNKIFVTPINYNENFKFYIKFRVEEKSNFDFSLKISKGIEDIAQYYKNEPYAVGAHELYFEVPKRTFYPGNYFLILSASNLTEKTWIVDSSRAAFSVPFAIVEE
jgi:lipopolysaccharide transport system ATP-binding protein